MSFDTDKIRNIAVIGGGRAGKTTMTDALLFTAKAIPRIGRIEDGTTTTDYEPEEISRTISISSALAFCDWQGCRLNIIDTPGYINFIEDSKACLSVADGVIAVVSALTGVKAENEQVWKCADSYKLPRLVFISKMDRDNADFASAVSSVEKAYDVSVVPLNIPIGAGPGFEGIIDVVNMKALKFKGGSIFEEEIPEELKSQSEEFRTRLIERVAESDDSLLEKYLEGEELSSDEINKGLKNGVLTGKLVPVFCGSSTLNIGMSQLLDAAVKTLPSPAEKAALGPVKAKDQKTGEEVIIKINEGGPLAVRVFKTIADPFAGKLTLFRVYSGSLKADTTVYNSTHDVKEKLGSVFYLQGKNHIPAQDVGPGGIAAVAKLKSTLTGDTLCDVSKPVIFDPIKFTEPMISYAIEPKSRGDEDKVSTGIHRLLEEDPTLKFTRDAETKDMILSGMGQVHLEVILEKLKRKFGTEVIMKAPKIAYRETIRTSADAQGKYKKQSGGKGQFGDCWVRIEPLPRGAGFEFINNVVGGSIPRSYIPAVEKGIIEAMAQGLYAGYPMVDLSASVYDGSYHSVDSSEMAFKIAGSFAIKKAVQDARPVLLEPIVKVEITVPDEYLGSIMGDLNTKRGKVQGVEQSGDNQKVVALVPVSEMLTYANQLNAITSGRGVYTMSPSHYDEVPEHIAKKIIEEKKEGQ
ncbi:MAG: elongation factor G [Thermodesulfovibrionia bacterium]|nr:elongation factor G [Thermodesulfovibrionia bacterium]